MRNVITDRSRIINLLDNICKDYKYEVYKSWYKGIYEWGEVNIAWNQMSLSKQKFQKICDRETIKLMAVF